MVRAASNNSSWAKQELEKKDAHIRRLEAENAYLLKAKKDIEVERDHKISVLGDLAKQNDHYRAYLERLNADKTYPNLVFDNFEIDQGPLFSLTNGPSSSYRPTVEPHPEVSSVESINNHAVASHLTAQPLLLDPDDLDVSTISIPVETDGLGRNIHSSLHELPFVPLNNEPQPLTQQQETPPATSSENSSPVSRSGHKLSSSNASHQAGCQYVRQRSFSSSPLQVPSVEGCTGDGEDVVDPRLTFGHAKVGLGGFGERTASAAASPRLKVVDHGEDALSRSPSDISMRSPSEAADVRESVRGETVHEPPPIDSSDSCSAETDDDDSANGSDEDPDTSVDAGENSVKDKDTEPTATGALNATTAPQEEDETDTDLKAAVRESYSRFGLDAQRLRFCYEPRPLDPTTINLNTNWKRRSKLNEAVMEKLQRAATEITGFLPESDTPKATKRETDLIRRLCNCNPSQVVCSSLKEVVGALRRERDVTKDELHLIEFELYSTLIIMKSQSEHEASDLTIYLKAKCPG